MSTRINTNTTAFMASMNLNMNSDNLSTDIQRLSTGLRINSAADDAAGLVISENMMAQVSGLNQATRNSNDAVNMIKTGEGALNEVQNLLISMRQLAVHASNLGVNDSTDVQADQTQIASAIQSINRIAATTQFGNKKLLDGSASSGVTVTNGSATASSSADYSVVAQGAWSSGNAYTFNSASAAAATSTSATYGTTTIAGSAAANITAANVGFGGSVAINGQTFNLSNSSSSPTPVTLTQLNTAIASSGYTASISGTNVVFTSNAIGPSTQPTIDTSKLVITGQTAATGAVSAASNVVTVAAAAGTGGNLAATGTTAVTGNLQLADSTAGLSFNKSYTSATSLAQVQSDLNAVFGTGATQVTASISAGALVFTGKAGDTVTSGSTGATFQAYNTATGGTPATAASTVAGAYGNLTITDGSHPLTSSNVQVVGSTYYYTFSNGLILSSTKAQSSSTTTLNGSLSATAGTTTTGSDLQFQIGAEGGQTASQSIQSVAAYELGKGSASYTDASGNTQNVLTGSVQDINVTTFKGAQDAIAVLDKAISDISTVRANLGAFQSNVLESNVRSLGIASTNLSASESTIRDTDLAATIVDYTKNQILVQAGTSALSYANQMPQSVLKLLQ